MTAAYKTTHSIASLIAPAVDSLERSQRRFASLARSAFESDPVEHQSDSDRVKSYDELLARINRYTKAFHLRKECYATRTGYHLLIRSELEAPHEEAVELLEKDQGLSVRAIREIDDTEWLCTLERWDYVCDQCGQVAELYRNSLALRDATLQSDNYRYAFNMDITLETQLANDDFKFVQFAPSGYSSCPACGHRALLRALDHLTVATIPSSEDMS